MPRAIRATDLGIRIGRFTPGPTDGITDVAGVHVAATTIAAGDGALRRGVGPIRTGATAILPRPLSETGHPLFAAATMTSADDATAVALPLDIVRAALD